MACRSDSIFTRSTLARSPRLIASTRCGGHALQHFVEVEVIAKALRKLFVGFGPRADQLAGAVEYLPQLLPQVGPLAQVLGQDVAHAQQRVGGAGHAAVGD